MTIQRFLFSRSLKYSALISVFAVLLSGCQTFNMISPQAGYIASPEAIKPIPKPAQPAYYKISEAIQCVPYAREKSGIQIFGNAHTWWGQAKRKGYELSETPVIGTVMVLSKAGKLNYGHLAVVTNIIDDRTIEVTHSNWGNSPETRRVIYNRMNVIDSSRNGDWSYARFWHYASGSYGSSYKVSGFIHPQNAMQQVSMQSVK